MMFTIILCMLQGHLTKTLFLFLYRCTFTTILGYVDRCFKPPIVICYCSITVLLSAVALNSSCWTTVVNVVKWVIIHTQPKVSSGFSGISRLPSCFFLLAYSIAYVNNVVINVQNFRREDNNITTNRKCP